MKKTPKLDKIDQKILLILQNSGRITNVDLADAVGLSPTPCFERVKRLEEAGYISGYFAKLRPDRLGLGLLAFVEVTLDRTDNAAFEKFQKSVETISEIQECHMVAGGFDYLLKVRVTNMDAYRRFLGERIADLPGVSRTHTYVVMEEVKDSAHLPINEQISHNILR